MNRTMRNVLCSLLIGLILLVGVSACSSYHSQNNAKSAETDAAAVQKTRTVTDMFGRSVTVPAKVNSIATFRAAGVLNTFIECLGKGDCIVNKMPANFTKTDRWAMQYKFAPQIKDAPLLENANGVDIEATLALKPDVCVTMTQSIADQLQEHNIPCIVLKWSNTDEIRQAVSLMGDVLGVPERAAKYQKYFDSMMDKAQGIVKTIPIEKRKKALFGDVKSLMNPHEISEWWIEKAGGISVTKKKIRKGPLKYTMEELLSWQPDVIFSMNLNISDIFNDPALAEIPAIMHKSVYPIPTVGHIWGLCTVEEPLTVMWAIHKMYPDLYSQVNLTQDIKYFYKEFFNYSMSDQELKKIIG